ncbi:MAG: YggS family pyridoxal phosphate-dependent enzyme [Alphaproteobacteria bacterium]|nr:YggS family pyridoxal phosphate-dependent enzyme [Alphaproteobacteria bacterium]
MTERIEQIRARMAAAAGRAGRDVGDILLLGVTKTVVPELVDEALQAGIGTFGENKIQEAKAKIPLVSSRARWHFIGHLQSNKARDAVQLFDVIHSVDSVKLAEEIDKWAERAGKTQPVLLEVNLAGEASKHGMKPEDVPAALERIQQLARLEVRGLMTVPPYAEEAEKVRPYFRQLRELRDQLGLRELSMGMSHDFEMAIEEGATIIRVGSALFGERKKHEPAD